MLPASHMQHQPHILLHNIYKNEGKDQGQTEKLALTAAGLSNDHWKIQSHQITSCIDGIILIH